MATPPTQRARSETSSLPDEDHPLDTAWLHSQRPWPPAVVTTLRALMIEHGVYVFTEHRANIRTTRILDEIKTQFVNLQHWTPGKDDRIFATKLRNKIIRERELMLKSGELVRCNGTYEHRPKSDREHPIMQKLSNLRRRERSRVLVEAIVRWGVAGDTDTYLYLKNRGETT